jgi:hypothetical protein
LSDQFLCVDEFPVLGVKVAIVGYRQQAEVRYSGELFGLLAPNRAMWSINERRGHLDIFLLIFYKMEKL